MKHSPYSPDLAPTDFYLFPLLKIKLNRHRFIDSHEVTEKCNEATEGTSQNMDPRNVLNSYTNIGSNVWMQTDSILKENKLKLL